ncbi:MAG TPA: hypothetical protein VHM19_06490, partial [Polyangiales bacterium]|nr:hypothetical protein [Polyangiales bacterium]
MAMLVAFGVAIGTWRAHSRGRPVQPWLGIVVKREDGTALSAVALTVTGRGLTLSARTDSAGRARIALPKKLSCKEAVVRVEAPGLVASERTVKLHGAFP